MKNSIIAETLVKNSTIKSHKNAIITGDFVGVDICEQWVFALKRAHEAFYTYQARCFNLIKNEPATIPDTTDAYTALQAILDLIGPVNDHKIVKSDKLLTILSKHAVRMKESYTGEAYTVNSELVNLRTQYRNVNAGMNPDYVAKLEKDIEATSARLKLLCATTDSADKTMTRTSWNTFRYNVETELANIINDQQAKSWEELEAEEEARRKERRARTKAKKAAAKTMVNSAAVDNNNTTK